MFQRNPSVSFYAQQSVVGRNIVGAGVDAGLQQSPRRAFCQIDDRHAALVPATGSAQSTRAGQVTMLANAPEHDQTNIPSSIWTSSSSTSRLPVSVFSVSKGVRRRRRGWGRRVQRVDGLTTKINQPSADLSNRTPELLIQWDGAKLGITGQELGKMVLDTEPRIE